VFPGEKSIPLKMSVMLLNIILKGRYPLSEQLIDFLAESNEPAVFRDTWNMLNMFLKTIKGDLSKFSSEGNY
jgi:Cullin binding